MNARIVATATIITSFAAVLAARAADSQLVSLVMPDAKVLGGVNVDQAKSTPFGMYILTQIQSSQDPHLQALIALTGFDPTRDVHELLMGSNSTPNTGLVLARGSFDVTRITAAATANDAVTETYNGVILIEDPKKTHGFAFLDSTLALAGDLASVKGAIDRSHGGQSLPSAIVTLVNQWSAAEDAWGLTTVPLSSLQPTAGVPTMPGMGAGGQNNVFVKVQQAAGGVKFGAMVVFTGQLQSDNAQDASSMSDTLKLLASLAQMQASKDPQAAQLFQALSISSQGSNVNITVSLPDAQFQQLVKLAKNGGPQQHHSPAKK